MDKILACFEISTKLVKLLVGYEMDSNPVVLYTKEVSIEGLIKDGKIVDRQSLISILKEFRTIDDRDKKIRLNITEAYLVLPSFGLSVYQNNKTTNVVAGDGTIAKIDIANVISLVNKEEIPNGNIIVDIIPDEFILDNGKRFVDPPIGEISNTLTIKAKIHGLPREIVSMYVGVMNDAGFRIKKSAVSSYCHAELFGKDPELPKTFILLDIGAKISTLSFIGDGSAYSSLFYTQGGDDLTNEIATNLNCSTTVAKALKENYGYNPIVHVYNPPLLKQSDQMGVVHTYTQVDLNKIIVEYVDGYLNLLQNSIASLLSGYPAKFNTLPLLITGGASKLNGLKQLLQTKITEKEIIIAKNKCVGANSPSYSALLGLVDIASVYKGALVDNQHGVRSVPRMNKKDTLHMDDEI